MQSTRYKIKLTDPCSENWDKMKSHPTGKFCDSCQKNVIDFTNKNELEITEYIKAHEGEKMCGRFYNHQIETIRIEFDRNILFTEIPFWQKFLVIVLVCFGPDLCGQHFAFAQTDTLVDSIPWVQQPIDTSLTTQIDSLNTPADSTFKLDLKLVLTDSIWATCGVGITLGGFWMEPEFIHETSLIVWEEPEEITSLAKEKEVPEKISSDTISNEHLDRSKSMRKPKQPEKKTEEPFIAVLPESTSENRSKRKEA